MTNDTQNTVNETTESAVVEKKKPSVLKILWDLFFWVVCVTIVFTTIFMKVRFIQTGSMEPTIHIGAIVVVNPKKEAKVGDVAMYTMGNGYVVHRIIKDNGDGTYTFKGDNNAQPDMDPIEKERVVGPVILKFNLISPVIRKLKHLD